MWYIILFISTLALDQISKIIVDANQTNITIWEGILGINIAHNDGAAFSFLSDKEWAQTFFIVLTSVVLFAGLLFILIKKPKGKWLNSCIALMLSGTIGNFIDRLAFAYVRDFIYVPFFANFNIADCCLCIGAGMLIFYVMFLDEDAVLPINKKGKKDKQNSEEKV